MRKRLFVSPNGLGGWKVHWEGMAAVQNHPTQDMAIKNARLLVGKLPAGTCSQILVKRPDGTFRTEWTYGRDPFPPRG